MSKIILVGFGPGSHDQMTFRAKSAIEEADVVIGYSTYIKLVVDLLDGKEVIKKGMTEEIDRCELAYAKAAEGKTVALISSGDIGIYGMAGPLYEYIFSQGWTPESKIKVEVVPGVTALSASASLVGAPLTHDFCSISLSDLLTPWSVIATRLEAAAKADFVVALYNPKSSRRSGQIEEATKILQKYKSPETPVALIKSAYRKKEKIVFATLKDLDKQEIGMLTTVLIGNQSTFIKNGTLVTPRGYSNKYDADGAVKKGEEAGVSLSTGLNSLPQKLLASLQEGTALDELEIEFGLPLGDLLQQLDQERLDVQETIHFEVVSLEDVLHGTHAQLDLFGFTESLSSFDLSILDAEIESLDHSIKVTGKGASYHLMKDSYSQVLSITLTMNEGKTPQREIFLIDSLGYLRFLICF